MHMAMVIGRGLVLFGLFLLIGRLGCGVGLDLATAVRPFISGWLVMSLVNIGVDVAKTGYSVRDELQILSPVFLMPTAIAGFATRWLAR